MKIECWLQDNLHFQWVIGRSKSEGTKVSISTVGSEGAVGRKIESGESGSTVIDSGSTGSEIEPHSSNDWYKPIMI